MLVIYYNIVDKVCLEYLRMALSTTGLGRPNGSLEELHRFRTRSSTKKNFDGRMSTCTTVQVAKRWIDYAFASLLLVLRLQVLG